MTANQKELTDDPTRMSKGEFLKMVDKANQGPLCEMREDEDLTSFLRRQGYAKQAYQSEASAGL